MVERVEWGEPFSRPGFLWSRWEEGGGNSGGPGAFTPLPPQAHHCSHHPLPSPMLPGATLPVLGSAAPGCSISRPVQAIAANVLCCMFATLRAAAGTAVLVQANLIIALSVSALVQVGTSVGLPCFLLELQPVLSEMLNLCLGGITSDWRWNSYD